MKKKLHSALAGVYRYYFILLSLLLLSSFSFGQTVTGTVSEGGSKALTGVTVTVKGKNVVTTTDAGGRFTINAAGTDTLTFTSVGYLSKEVAINNRSSLTVALDIDTQVIGEVVVTALGITKEARRLGYSATNVKPDELTINRTANPLNALQGKVAGLNISTLGTGPGSTGIR